MSQKKKSPADPSFEEAFARLEEIVAGFEAEELELEKTMALFEEGMTLAKRCQDQLDRFQERLARLMAVGQEGTPEEPEEAAG